MNQNQLEVQQSRKSSRLEKEWPLQVAIQAYTKYVKNSASHLPAIVPSLRITHVVQRRIALQISPIRCLAYHSFQLTNRSTTLIGITHCTPNKHKTNNHSFLATRQCHNRWSTDSPSCLHIQHQSTIGILRLLKLTTVRIFPKRAIQVKKATFVGTLTFQILF